MCDRHGVRHFEDIHDIALRKPEIQWLVYPEGCFRTLNSPCAQDPRCDKDSNSLCLICEVSFCSSHLMYHECVGTWIAHQDSTRTTKEFTCKNCKILFKEFQGSGRYGEFTIGRDDSLLQSCMIITKKQKEAYIIKDPLCLICERKADEAEYKAAYEVPEYIPYVLPPLMNNDDSDDSDNEQVPSVSVRDDGPAVTSMGAGNDPTISDNDRAAIATGALDGDATADADADCHISSVSPATNKQAERIITEQIKSAINCSGVQQADKYKFYLENVGPCELWYQDITLSETMLGCLPGDNRELIVHVFFCCNENPFYALFWEEPDNVKNWLIETVQLHAYDQMINSGLVLY